MAPPSPSGLTHGQLHLVRLADSEAALRAAGFDLLLPLGTTTLAPDCTTGGMAAGIEGVDELDGLTLTADDPVSGPSGGPVVEHPNGVQAIDHVVVMTPNPDRTRAAFETAGLEARRERRFETSRGPQRQTFHWLGDTICEVVGPDDGKGDDPARWWGLALTVADIEVTADRLDGLVTPIKPAVQPGRHVCTLRHPDITTPVLFISPHGGRVSEEPA